LHLPSEEASEQRPKEMEFEFQSPKPASDTGDNYGRTGQVRILVEAGELQGF